MRWFIQEDYRLFASLQVLLVDELRHRMIAAGQSGTAVARALRLRPNTVTELLSDVSDFVYHNVRTLTAVAGHLGSRLEAVPFDSEWG